MQTMNELQTIPVIVGAILAAALEHLPGLKQRFAELKPYEKQIIILAMCALVVATLYYVSCTGAAAWVTCPENGWLDGAMSFVLMVAANQGAHRIIKRHA